MRQAVDLFTSLVMQLLWFFLPGKVGILQGLDEDRFHHSSLGLRCQVPSFLTDAFPAPLRYNCHIMSWKLKMYNVMIWYIHIYHIFSSLWHTFSHQQRLPLHPFQDLSLPFCQSVSTDESWGTAWMPTVYRILILSHRPPSWTPCKLADAASSGVLGCETTEPQGIPHI